MTLSLTKQFKRAIQDDPSKCVLFVGAGLSASGVREDGNGIPDWHSLMQHMIEDLRDSEKCDAEALVQLETMLEESRYLEIAKFFKQRTRSDQFGAFLKAELDPPDLVTSQVHETILKVNFRGIVTTNFDLVFEHHSNRLQPLVYPQCLDDIDSFRRQGFFAKIHGCIRNTPNLAENLVLTEESYAALRANHKYHTILHSLFVMHPLLTVGFSLRDPDFLGLVDDLREIFGAAMPTIYALMREPGHQARDEWREQGVEIIPYQNHEEIVGFFDELLRLSESKHPIPTVTPAASESAINYEALLEKWRRTSSIEEAYKIVQDQMERLPNDEQRESFLFQLLALSRSGEQMRFSPHLVALNTSGSERVLLSLSDKAEEENYWNSLKPNPTYISLHEWVMQHWPDFTRRDAKHTFAWLLDKSWREHRIDLWDTFISLLNKIVATQKWQALDDLYNASRHIEGAPERIEKIVFAPDFVRDDDPQYRWFKSWDQAVVDHVRYEKFKSKMQSGTVTGYRNQIAEAVTAGYPEYVIKRFLEEYVHLSHLTLHSSSSLYDPEKASEILDALAELKDKEQQLSVLREIDHWPERMRGLGSLGEDAKMLREGLFNPLWWRYSSETRVEYLKGHKHGKMHGLIWRTGQELLLEDMMGLAYDIDQDFREAFNSSLSEHRSLTKHGKYEPRPFQEIWGERELTYKFSDEVPPELIRRIAVKRVDWENSQPGQVRWREALERAGQRMENRNLADFVSKESGDYVIDNLLGAYFPVEVEVVLYVRMIEQAAADLGVDKDALSTVVYIHETVHAYSHVGKDRDGRRWTDFSMPLSNQPDFHPHLPSEAIAQYYTFKLLEMLGDKELMQTFLTLERHSSDVYKAWRATETYTLEEMRNILVAYRKKGAEWPPS